jgi:Icc-related predicted phosphoesterase
MPRRAPLYVVVLLHVAACAAPQKPAPPPPPAPTEPAATDASPLDPKSWAEVPEKIGGACPGPLFKLPKPEAFTLKGAAWSIEGSTMRRAGGPWQGKLTLGVLGAVKDAEDGTRRNIQKAMKLFAKQQVDFVVVNGDIAESNEVRRVFQMLGEELTLPIFVHSGNIEWTTAFTDAWIDVAKQHPHLVNMNWIRHVDFGGVHLVSLPGWSVRRYVKDGACYYDAENVDALRPLIDEIKAAGGTVILTAHGPPKSFGKAAIDTADLSDGFQNVGDEALQKLILEEEIPFGLFSHILEAGGRATSDLKKGAPLKMPMKQGAPRLYINAGSSSSFGWQMNDGSTSRGLAAVVVVEGKLAKASFVQLWK